MNDTPEQGELPPNDLLVLISGESGTGKTAALRNIPNKERWLFLNCEAGKRPPFRANWFNAGPQGTVITDPYQVHEAFDFGTANKDVDGIIIDTATFLMDMFESVYIVGSTNSQAMWGAYQQFWKTLMQQKVTAFGKPTIILAHTRAEVDEAQGIVTRQVPVKGALKGSGLEAYFSTIVSTKRMELKHLKEQDPELLHIDEEDEALGFKNVFQTRITKGTTGERIRSPIGLFGRNQTYMDNDAALLMRHLHVFYGS